MKQVKGIIIMSFLLNFCLPILGQGFDTSVLPSQYHDVCNYKDFIDSGISPEEKQKKQDLYLKLLGALNILADYRQQFLNDGNFINLFPTAYFHTTASEMLLIVGNNTYNRPIEKMEQMLAFFDAYQENRLKYNTGGVGVEAHWLTHFVSSNQKGGSFFADIASTTYNALSTGIDAHVDVDLPRAINYSFSLRKDKSITQQKLYKDFKLTDNIFGNTQNRAMNDVYHVYPELDVNTQIPIGGGIFNTLGGWIGSLWLNVKGRRKDAWQEAFSGKKFDPQPVTNHNLLINKAKKICPLKPDNISLFLIDVSGSMTENNKIGQAKQSATSTIETIRQESQQSGKSPEIGIMVFSGGCVPDPTILIQPFSTDLDEVQNSVTNIPFPDGGTPSPQAIERARETLEKQLSQNGQTCGSLIVMTDGQSSCGTIIPPNAYSGKRVIKICGQQNGSSAANITVYAVGFNIPPGSVAERELQYLANTSGGKYFNAQDQYQLTRSFQKINRIYTPIATPQTKTVDGNSMVIFDAGYVYVTSTQQYDTALALYKKFTTTYPSDSSGLYNYALMCEANERYKSAVKYYELYLQSAPNDPSRQFLLDRIATLRKDYEIFLTYNKQVIQSDLAYLDQHFKQLQYTPDAVPLAGEFTGFIQEKQPFYKSLPEILEMDDIWLKQYAKEIAQALKEATYFLSKNPKHWDVDGISMISNVYEPLGRLAKKLGN